MSDRVHWECPFCGVTAVLINGSDRTDHMRNLVTETSKHGNRGLRIVRTICPNPRCKEIELTVAVHKVTVTTTGLIHQTGALVQQWRLSPESRAKVLPSYIPGWIHQEYLEACRTVPASAKSAATLARRCLQGMIRDFWGIKKKNLAAAIRALKSKVSPAEYSAIDAVREVGNIGAHMEKDPNVIIEVDGGEAEKLIRLIELLIEDWYVRQHQKEALLTEVREIADDKEALRKARKPGVPPSAGVESDSLATTEEAPPAIPSGVAQEPGDGTVAES
jgi:hypothetical protein